LTRIAKHALYLVICLSIWGFKSKDNQQSAVLKIQTKNDSMVCDSLFCFAKQYIDKPYCYGSKTPKCFDCSGLVRHVFSHFGVELPHCSDCQGKLGKFVSPKNAMRGDLIFFNGRQKNSETVGHVGIVSHIEGEKIFFIHDGTASATINTTRDFSFPVCS
jgi:NAD-dependent SIR2 family protein deacetylase